MKYHSKFSFQIKGYDYCPASTFKESFGNLKIIRMQLLQSSNHLRDLIDIQEMGFFLIFEDASIKLCIYALFNEESATKTCWDVKVIKPTNPIILSCFSHQFLEILLP